VFLVDTSAAPATLFGGGDINVTEVTPNPGSDAQRIGRGDWVMLLNADPAAPGTIRSLQFFRVTEGYEPTGGGKTFSLQGGDFELADATGNAFPTYMVFMNDVIAVYEHTFRWETNSNWN
jgi:hypothetical protein